MKSGDRVWIPGTIHAEVAGRTQPIYEVDALGDVPADRVLPDSPALPTVARWLSEHGAEQLADICTLAGLVAGLAGSLPGRRETMAAADALRAALEGS